MIFQQFSHYLQADKVFMCGGKNKSLLNIVQVLCTRNTLILLYRWLGFETYDKNLTI